MQLKVVIGFYRVLWITYVQIGFVYVEKQVRGSSGQNSGQNGFVSEQAVLKSDHFGLGQNELSQNGFKSKWAALNGGYFGSDQNGLWPKWQIRRLFDYS